MKAIGDALAIARYHILLVAMAATLVFGWLITGRYLFALALVAGLDWFLINLMNRITDLAEDAANGIRGTEQVAARKRFLTWTSVVLMVGSLVATAFFAPRLLPFRLAVQAIGLGYNYKIVPTPSGMSRFKEIYFLKNFGSSVLFTLTGFAYPLALSTTPRLLSPPAIFALALFFIPFELTYEILYDLRDLEGDRRENVPTYPVVHGPIAARRIIDGLLVFSCLVLIASVGTGLLGLREALMLFAPAAQFVFYRPRVARGLTSRDCILLTHLGTAQLLLFLAGTAVWNAIGLPADIYLFKS